MLKNALKLTTSLVSKVPISTVAATAGMVGIVAVKASCVNNYLGFIGMEVTSADIEKLVGKALEMGVDVLNDLNKA